MENQLFNFPSMLWQNLSRYRFMGMNMNFCPACGSKLQQNLIDGVVRLTCSRSGCDYVHWNNPLPVVAALVEYEGRYIIARNVQWPEEIYSVITGYLEAGESPEQAVVREVQEELGLSWQSVRHIGNYAFYKKNQVILAYEIRASGSITTNHELAAIKLLSPGELAEYDFGPFLVTKRIIQDWKN